jgi:hypothetical protein
MTVNIPVISGALYDTEPERHAEEDSNGKSI